MKPSELILTDMILERAKILRKDDNKEDLSIEPPNLQPYVEQAVKELKAWHKVVMKEVLKDS